MNIAEAKKQVEDTVEAYLEKDEDGFCLIPVARQRPLFLIGAPGIGKTAIMEQVANKLGIGLVSYSMTHHTRQSALGLPTIQHHDFEGLAYDASEYTMSEIIAAIYDYMESTGLRQGILFLDEVNCVSETLYPSMLQFLQFKTFGRHRVPENWVIVCAGNPPEYNKSVHEFDIVTLDRMRKLEIEPDFKVWKEYAENNGVHPAISTFLDIKRENFYYVENKPGDKSFVTARGWSDLSDMILLFERLGKPVDFDLIIQFIQEKSIAEQFAIYYDLFDKYRSDYQVDKILDGVASSAVIERAREAQFDERLALLGLMLDALSIKMNAALELEGVLIAVRDAVRVAKPQLIDGAILEETICVMIEDWESRLAMAEANFVTTVPELRERKRAIALLRELYAICKVEGADSGSKALECISENFAKQAARLDELIGDAERSLGNAFSFVEDAFQDERELLVFTTELSSRRIPSQFVNRFGSDSYYAHNKVMLVGAQNEELMSRIEDLGIS